MPKEKGQVQQTISFSPYINIFKDNKDMMDNIYHDEELSVELSDDTSAILLLEQYGEES